MSRTTLIKSSLAALLASAVGTTAYLLEKKSSVSLEGKSYTSIESIRSLEINKQQSEITLQEAITRAKELCKNVKEVSGSPGLVVAVSLNGKLVFSNGFGYANVENGVRCNNTTVMRIASISKSLTMTAVAKAWQNGILSLDKPVQDYVPEFPEKNFEGEKAEITLRLLVSHLSGIRHYEKKAPPTSAEDSKKDETPENKARQNEFDSKEYLINTHYDTVLKSLDLFKDDELHNKPGAKFLYTTHGWTLISAILESVIKEPFPKYMKSFFHELGLHHTYLDENAPIIYNRSQYYIRNKNGKLENAPMVDNSYKLAGGGFLSTAEDLVKFGNAMLYSFQYPNGFLKREAAQMLWTPVENASPIWDKDGQYGMGWGVVAAQENYPYCKSRRFYVSHTGGAIGASSVLLVYPSKLVPSISDEKEESGDVEGVVVAMIANLQNVGLNQTALEIAQTFDAVSH